MLAPVTSSHCEAPGSSRNTPDPAECWSGVAGLLSWSYLRPVSTTTSVPSLSTSIVCGLPALTDVGCTASRANVTVPPVLTASILCDT